MPRFVRLPFHDPPSNEELCQFSTDIALIYSETLKKDVTVAVWVEKKEVVVKLEIK